jgi:flagellar basal-body rod protein FlgG
MNGSTYMSATGALAYENRLQLISNNLANVNSAGYKKDKSRFESFDLEALATGTTRSVNLNESQASEYWMEYTTYTDFSAGKIKKTGNPFDLALSGTGFFCVQTPDGIQYTRRGDFIVNADEVLVTQEGWPVLGKSGEIQLKLSKPDDNHREFSVSEDGFITLDGSQVDRLRIIHVTQSHALEKAGHNYFRALEPNALKNLDEDLNVSQGFLEMSNVDTVAMMTEMIEVLRGYETYQKMMRSEDEMNSRLINDVGRA